MERLEEDAKKVNELVAKQTRIREEGPPSLLSPHSKKMKLPEKDTTSAGEEGQSSEEEDPVVQVLWAPARAIHQVITLNGSPIYQGRTTRERTIRLESKRLNPPPPQGIEETKKKPKKRPRHLTVTPGNMICLLLCCCLYCACGVLSTCIPLVMPGEKTKNKKNLLLSVLAVHKVFFHISPS